MSRCFGSADEVEKFGLDKVKDILARVGIGSGSAISMAEEAANKIVFLQRQLERAPGPTLTPEQIKRSRLFLAAFQPAPPEADIEDPDYGF